MYLKNFGMHFASVCSAESIMRSCPMLATKNKHISLNSVIVYCIRGCKRSVRSSVDMSCPTKEQGEVRIAFVIMASDSSWKGAPDISLLQELLKALDDPAFYIIIHIDQNSSQHFKEAVAALASGQPKISLVQNPLGCTWAGECCPQVPASNSVLCVAIMYC